MGGLILTAAGGDGSARLFFLGAAVAGVSFPAATDVFVTPSVLHLRLMQLPLDHILNDKAV